MNESTLTPGYCCCPVCERAYYAGAMLINVPTDVPLAVWAGNPVWKANVSEQQFPFVDEYGDPCMIVYVDQANRDRIFHSIPWGCSPRFYAGEKYV
jgi:hypothetical protein